VRATDGILARPRAQELWRDANRTAHQLFIAIVEEEDLGRFRAESDDLVLDLRPLVVRVRQSLGVGGTVPAEAGRVVVMSSERIGTARTGEPPSRAAVPRRGVTRERLHRAAGSPTDSPPHSIERALETVEGADVTNRAFAAPASASLEHAPGRRAGGQRATGNDLGRGPWRVPNPDMSRRRPN
jgi:hypothetical protein